MYSKLHDTSPDSPEMARNDPTSRQSGITRTRRNRDGGSLAWERRDPDQGSSDAMNEALLDHSGVKHLIGLPASNGIGSVKFEPVEPGKRCKVIQGDTKQKNGGQEASDVGNGHQKSKGVINPVGVQSIQKAASSNGIGQNRFPGEEAQVWYLNNLSSHAAHHPDHENGKKDIGYPSIVLEITANRDETIATALRRLPTPPATLLTSKNNTRAGRSSIVADQTDYGDNVRPRTNPIIGKVLENCEDWDNGDNIFSSGVWGSKNQFGVRSMGVEVAKHFHQKWKDADPQHLRAYLMVGNQNQLIGKEGTVVERNTTSKGGNLRNDPRSRLATKGRQGHVSPKGSPDDDGDDSSDNDDDSGEHPPPSRRNPSVKPRKGKGLTPESVLREAEKLGDRIAELDPANPYMTLRYQQLFENIKEQLSEFFFFPIEGETRSQTERRRQKAVEDRERKVQEFIENNPDQELDLEVVADIPPLQKPTDREMPPFVREHWPDFEWSTAARPPWAEDHDWDPLRATYTVFVGEDSGFYWPPKNIQDSWRRFEIDGEIILETERVLRAPHPQRSSESRSQALRKRFEKCKANLLGSNVALTRALNRWLVDEPDIENLDTFVAKLHSLRRKLFHSPMTTYDLDQVLPHDDDDQSSDDSSGDSSSDGEPDYYGPQEPRYTSGDAGSLEYGAEDKRRAAEKDPDRAEKRRQMKAIREQVRAEKRTGSGMHNGTLAD